MKKKLLITVLAFIMVSTFAFTSFAKDNNDLETKITQLEEKIANLEKALAERDNTPQDSFYCPITACDPFSEMDMFDSLISRLLQPQKQRFTTIMPQKSNFFNAAMDMKETSNAYIVTLDVPGMEKSNINLEIKDNYLIVSGEKKSESEEEDKNSNYYRKERSIGYFSRTIPLPKNIKTDAIDAKYKNGVLKITIPKENKSNKNKFKIKIN